MVEVVPNLKSNFGECQGFRDRCSRGDCPIAGSLMKPNRDGRRRIRGCGDPVARGAANRRGGLNKQRKARQALGIPAEFGASNEERWSDQLFANEVKSGAQIRPAFTAWLRIEAQVMANEPSHGGLRKPTRAVLMPDGFGGDGIVMVRLSTWRDLIRPALDEHYGMAH